MFLQEIAAYLISFDRHEEWLSYTLKTRYTPGTLPVCVSVLVSNTTLFLCQAKEWQHHPLQQEEGEVQERWIQLEEKERWKNDTRGSHEAEGQGHGGEDKRPLHRSDTVNLLLHLFFTNTSNNNVVSNRRFISLLSVPVRMLCPFLHCADIPQTMLLVVAGHSHTHAHTLQDEPAVSINQ